MENVKIFLIITLSVLISYEARANGDIDYMSRAVGSGDAIVRPGITLLSEHVDFVLRNDNYSAHVSYHANVAHVPFAGTVYFPIFGRSYGHSAGEAVVEDFRLSVNGNAVPVNTAPLALRERLEGLNTVLSDDRFEHLDGEVTAIFQGEILSSTHELTLDIFYTAPYNMVIESWGDGADLASGIVELYYDFSPASAWVTEPVPFIRVTFDVSELLSAVSWRAPWDFIRNGDVFTAVFENTFMRDMPPLNLYVAEEKDQFVKKHYPTYKRYIEAYPFDYTLTSQDTLFDPNNAYRPENAADWTLSTAWCSRQEHPTIRIRIPKEDVDWNLTTEDYSGNQLLGIGFGNGYPKSPSVWQANRRVKAGKIVVREKGHRSMTAEFTVEDPDMTDPQYPFNTLQIISFVSDYHDQEARYHITHYPLEQRELSAESDDLMQIDVTITETYPGTAYADVCLAELFPVFFYIALPGD
jgi:hypothetical protein